MTRQKRLQRYAPELVSVGLQVTPNIRVYYDTDGVVRVEGDADEIERNDTLTAQSVEAQEYTYGIAANAHIWGHNVGFPRCATSVGENSVLSGVRTRDNSIGKLCVGKNCVVANVILYAEPGVDLTIGDGVVLIDVSLDIRATTSIANGVLVRSAALRLGDHRVLIQDYVSGPRIAGVTDLSDAEDSVIIGGFNSHIHIGKRCTLNAPHDNDLRGILNIEDDAILDVAETLGGFVNLGVVTLRKGSLYMQKDGRVDNGRRTVVEEGARLILNNGKQSIGGSCTAEVGKFTDIHVGKGGLLHMTVEDRYSYFEKTAESKIVVAPNTGIEVTIKDN